MEQILDEMTPFYRDVAAEEFFHAEQEPADLAVSGNVCPWILEGLDFTNARFSEVCDVLNCLAPPGTPFQSSVCELQASYELLSKSTNAELNLPSRSDLEIVSSYGRCSNDSCDMLLAESINDDFFGRAGCAYHGLYAAPPFVDHVGDRSSSKSILKLDRNVAKMLAKNDARDQRNSLFCCTINSSSPRSTVDDDCNSKSTSPSKGVCRPLDCPQNQNTNKIHVDEQIRTKQRAPTRRVAQMRLAELSKYFNMPINEASKKLKVGVTVLKRKCREFGVSRWPHRKIKSLDSLIRSIQDSAKANQEGQVKDRAALITKSLEEERNLIQSRPDMQLDSKIKRLRQASFKNSFKTRQKQQVMKQTEELRKELKNGTETHSNTQDDQSWAYYTQMPKNGGY